jgi:hypothetical protein
MANENENEMQAGKVFPRTEIAVQTILPSLNKTDKSCPIDETPS